MPYFWEDFFNNLNINFILSPKTNKEIVNIGVKNSDSETCFSNKVYWGHFLWLENKCDTIFVPRLKTNKKKLEYCLRFFALPDLAEIMTKMPILSITFDERKEKFKKTIQRLGKKLGKNRSEVELAFNNTIKRQSKLKEKKIENFFKKIKSKKKKIVIISHPYNLYDDYLNSGIKDKLKKLGVMPFFIDEFPIDENKPYKYQLKYNINFHWEFGGEIMEQIGKSINYRIDGAIMISSYACGCDSVLKEFVELSFKENKIPFLFLIIDEQTGDAGLQTRLEAFLDTINKI